MILLDTQAAVWMTTDKRALTATARDAIREAARSSVGLSIASSTLWEIAMISGKGRFPVPSNIGVFLRHLEAVFTVLPITAAIAERSIQFSASYPKDPTDRIIGATALIHGLKLITADAAIRASGELECIW
jgi:PIN domain nuclease of toxin-antitoxin system